MEKWRRKKEIKGVILSIKLIFLQFHRRRFKSFPPLIRNCLQIVTDAHQLVFSFVDKADLTGKVNYASIFDKQPSGNYYLLNDPVDTDFGKITICRVRSYDNEHLERGYLDFETVNYSEFKKKYLVKPYFNLMKLPHVELVGLHTPNHNVRAYFPECL